MTSKQLSLLALSIVICGFLIYCFVTLAAMPTVRGAFGIPESSVWATVVPAVLAFLATLFGVLLGAVYRRLSSMQAEGRETSNLVKVIGQSLASIDFQIGLVGSPVVFGLLWQAIADISTPGMLIIALQNGFSCHAVLKEVTPFTGTTTS